MTGVRLPLFVVLCLGIGFLLVSFFNYRRAGVRAGVSHRRLDEIPDGPPMHHAPQPRPVLAEPSRPRRRLIARLMAAAAVIATLGGAFYALAYPALFPPDVAPPAVELDPAEGRVWLDSQVVIELRGSFSEDDVLDALEVDPPLDITADHIDIEREATLSWHEDMPWATTRVVINPARAPLFDAGTEYEISVRDQSVVFQTITVPEVVSAVADADADANFADVPTTSPITFTFNEEIVWRDEYVTLEPAATFASAANTDDQGRTVVRLTPAPRWENATGYNLTVHPGIRDVHDHASGETFSLSFGTWQPPKVIGATPVGMTQLPNLPVRVQFERPADRASVEATLAVQPQAVGSFTWESDQVMLWQPNGHLPFSTEFTATIAGRDTHGDAFPAHTWTWRTQDPPVGAELVGSATSPTVLEVQPRGGLGSFSYQWSDGTTGHKALVVVPHGEKRLVEVRVTSGDQVAVKQIEVSGPLAPRDHVPVGCPEGWDMVTVSICYRTEELSGPIRTYLTRIDPRDPDLEITSALAADALGGRRTVSEAAGAHGSLLSVNGDFFQPVAIGHVPVGPLITDGNIVQIDRRFDAGFAVARDGRAWATPVSDSYIVLSGQAGDAVVRHVNTAPPEGEAAVFNSYRGASLLLPFEACYATFAASGGSLSPLNHACGPVSNVPLANDRVVIVARGAAAGWLTSSLAAPLNIFDPLGLLSLDLLVGGSHLLIRDGVPQTLGGAHMEAGPRTMIGVDAAGFVYLVVVDGRSGESTGMSLPALQSYAQQIGLTQALNLDGGGSSEMVLFGGIRNRPSDGPERPVTGTIDVTRPVGDCAHPLVRCR
jgi:Phosphodiester glycosidase/Bacterial Ig-like domain